MIYRYPNHPPSRPKTRNHLGSEVMSSEALLEYPALFCPTRWHGFLTLQLGGEHLRWKIETSCWDELLREDDVWLPLYFWPIHLMQCHRFMMYTVYTNTVATMKRMVMMVTVRLLWLEVSCGSQRHVVHLNLLRSFSEAMTLVRSRFAGEK